VVVLVEVVAATLVAAAVSVASVELLTSEAAVLVRRTQSLEEQPTAEVESASACIVLRLFRTLRLHRHMSVPSCRRGHP